MFVVINCCKKIDAFDLYTNSFYPLYRDRSMSYIDLTREDYNDSFDFASVRKKVEDQLLNAKISKYDLVILYDFEFQKKDPIVFSVTGMLNNLERQVIEYIKTSFVVDHIYFISIDTTERDRDGQIIDPTLKMSIEFDKNGYIDESTVPYFINITDLEKLDAGYDEVIVKKKQSQELMDCLQTYDKEYLTPLENRIIKSFGSQINPNNKWYLDKIKYVFKEYRNELKAFLDDVNNGERSAENINFGLKDYLKCNISSYDMEKIQQNKVFRLNMLDERGRDIRNEFRYRNYFKIVAFIVYLITQEKKYIFESYANIDENHYIIDVTLDDNTIEGMMISYGLNIESEHKRLGTVRFNDMLIEEYAITPIDANIKYDKKYYPLNPKLSLFDNDNNINDTKVIADYYKQMYIDYVRHCNDRLRTMVDSLRTKLHRGFSGNKKSVTINEYNSLIKEKEEYIKTLKEKIAQNTPADIIQVDYTIFDANNEKVNKANDILKTRSSFVNLIINAALILFISLIIFVFARRFNNGLPLMLSRVFMFLVPTLIYLVSELVLALLKINKVKKYMTEIETYTKMKREEINVDDEKFKVYVNDIYELMMLTKYVNNLKSAAIDGNANIENYKYHELELEEKNNDNTRLLRLLRYYIPENGKPIKNINLDMNKKVVENDLYCPLYFVAANSENYILINNQQQEKLSGELLNFVDNIQIRFDEVYRELI